MSAGGEFHDKILGIRLNSHFGDRCAVSRLHAAGPMEVMGHHFRNRCHATVVGVAAASEYVGGRPRAGYYILSTLSESGSSRGWEGNFDLSHMNTIIVVTTPF